MNISCAHTLDLKKTSEDICGATFFLLPAKKEFKKNIFSTLSKLDKDFNVDWQKIFLKNEAIYKYKSNHIFHCDLKAQKRAFVTCLPKKKAMFLLLKFARKIFQNLDDYKSENVVVDLREIDKKEYIQKIIYAITASLNVNFFVLPKYLQKKEEDKLAFSPKNIVFLIPSAMTIVEAQQTVEKSRRVSQGTNRVRELAMRAGNDLTVSSYINYVTELAKKNNLVTVFYDQKKLKTLGAGAFLAVAQGSVNEDAGVLKISYEPKGKKIAKKICLVGKGVTFDTGGLNIKTRHMYGMNQDMAGSAVALSLILQAQQEKWPIAIDCFMAIAENAISSKAYRPNDVVHTINKLAIEVIDTDAEGRMLLSDTLCLASEAKPNLIMTFATLTGACVRAIGTNYAGAFLSRMSLAKKIMKAGKRSGERVWPFPNDRDYADCLESDIADVKQCRTEGGVDHLEAFQFLRKFVAKKIDFVHIDLSSAQNAGGLAHVSTETTGFGVGFASEFIHDYISHP